MEFSRVRVTLDQGRGGAALEEEKESPRFVAGDRLHFYQQVFFWTVVAASRMIRRGVAGANEENHEGNTRCENNRQ